MQFHLILQTLLCIRIHTITYAALFWYVGVVMCLKASLTLEFQVLHHNMQNAFIHKVKSQAKDFQNLKVDTQGLKITGH